MAALRARGFGRSSVFDQVTAERVARTFCLLSRDGQHHLDVGAAGEVSVGFCDETLWSLLLVVSDAIFSARKAASLPTHPSSAEPRVCCHVWPSRYRPGDDVSPRWWMIRPRSSFTSGIAIHEWSSR